MSVDKTDALELYPGYISKVHITYGKKKFEMLCQHDSYMFGDYQLRPLHPSCTFDGRQVYSFQIRPAVTRFTLQIGTNR